MNLCSACGLNFTSRTAFDKHQTMLADSRGTVVCHVPAECGLEEKPVRQYNGKQYRTYGMLAAEHPHYTENRGAAMETTLIRKCAETGKPFVAWGRGRPPVRLGQGRAEAVHANEAAIGKYIDREGNIYDARPADDGVKAKDTVKAKPASKPASKPATAKAVPQARPAVRPADTQPAQHVQVPPPPPAVVASAPGQPGKTAAQALQAGDLHADTFNEPPFAEDAFSSLYDDPDAVGLVAPEPDDYMHTLLATGQLNGSTVA